MNINVKSKISTASLAAVLLVLVLTGCKPTEKNYRAAYDKARLKREAEQEARREIEQDLNIVGTGVVQEVDGVRLETIGDETVWVLHQRIKSDPAVGPYALAVARMGMRANALALAEDYEGWRAVKAGDSYLVLAGEADTPDGILLLKHEFEKRHKDFRPLNLPGVTIVTGN